MSLLIEASTTPS